MAPTTLKPKKFWTLALLGLAIVTTILLAAGIAHIEFLPGQPFPLAGFLQLLAGVRASFIGGVTLPLNIMRPLMACVWVMLFISIVAFIISPEVRREAIKRLIRMIIYAMVIYGLVTVLQPLLAERMLSQPASGGELTEAEEAQPPLKPPDFVVNPPTWMVYAIDILLLVIPLTIAWLIWTRWRVVNKESPLELLTQEAQEALTRLQMGHNLKDTIMRCYAEMSQILQQQKGVQRKQAMTPREFEGYLAQSGLSDEHIWRLTRLFERVRYGGKTPGQAEEQEAVACLQAIVQAYGKAS
jgi:hypothetical protein